ncbi:MAG: hypothetical protein IJ725_04370, partial [Ruminococcus sp.]|nr:hypothetical protein [Ruminococcus sp.]
MRKLKQFISVFLCAAVCCSAFAISVQAKTAKKYVKSISVAKKATITIPASKKTVAKKYKVTVKTAGKASKKFTAKSNKTSVATVKVSGSYVKVTAKKAGKVTITVTTKAKNAKNKKLSKKLVLTVKKAKAQKTSKASLDPYYENIQLECSKYVKSEFVYEARQVIGNMIDLGEESAEYTAKIADESVAYTAKDKSGLLNIYAKSTGSTTAEIIEKFNGKERTLGTVNISVTETSFDNAVYSAVLGYYNDETPSIWIKSDLGADKSDLNALFKTILVDNKELGTTFKEDEFTVSAKIDDESIANIDANNIITGVKNGETYLNVTLRFTNGTNFESSFTLKVTGNAIEKIDGYTMENIRDYIVGLDTPVELRDGTTTPMINFDNAATTPAFKVVQDAINEELEMYGSIGRGFS